MLFSEDWNGSIAVPTHEGDLTAEGCIGKLITPLAKAMCSAMHCEARYLRGKSPLRRGACYFRGKPARLHLLESGDRRSLEELTVESIMRYIECDDVIHVRPRLQRAPDACPTFSRSLEHIYLIPASLSKRAFMWVVLTVMQK
jgi:hypothetical protein